MSNDPSNTFPPFDFSFNSPVFAEKWDYLYKLWLFAGQEWSKISRMQGCTCFDTMSGLKYFSRKLSLLYLIHFHFAPQNNFYLWTCLFILVSFCIRETTVENVSYFSAFRGQNWNLLRIVFQFHIFHNPKTCSEFKGCLRKNRNYNSALKDRTSCLFGYQLPTNTII